RSREKTNRIHRGPRDRNGSLGATVVGERHALPRSCTTSVVAERSLSDQLTDSLVSCRRNEWPSGVRQRSPNPTCGEAPGSGDKPPPSASPPRRRAHHRTPSPLPEKRLLRSYAPRLGCGRGSPAGRPRWRCRPCRSLRCSPGPSSSGRGPEKELPGGRWTTPFRRSSTAAFIGYLKSSRDATPGLSRK